ncbi:SCAN domain-containing protein 3-like [Homarus americanus]|uniref:SCAN domain-containing protein 3-like n=1 Tax=Homarus americanus TaxID=6706 RepID=UPI001C492F02|nr:SCAN domain-containing protein 3-like [Homarus americanus]
MKRGRLENHLKAKHSIHVNSKLEYFKSLKEKFEKRSTINSLFSARSASKDRGLEASYEISLLIAKCGKNHTIGENLIKPAITTFLKVGLEKDDQDLKSMPLSNNTFSSRIDEMSCDVEVQLVEKLKYTNFSIQLDESTVRDSEALLMAYVRYVDNGEFIEDMLFCEALETTTIAIDIYKKLKTYLDDKQIPMENIISCAADGAPVMMGKKNGVLKLLKDDNPQMLLVHCVIHRQNLVSKKVSPVLNETLNAVIKCINTIKANAKCERLFKQFCKDQNADYVRLLLHTDVRWLSNGNCLKRFMELFDILSEFLDDKPYMTLLLTVDGKALVSYLADIFEKLNVLNKELQGTNMTLVNSKAKIIGFISFLELSQENISVKKFEQFYWLNKCEVTDATCLVIVEHLKIMVSDFNFRFSDLKEINYPSWMTQPLLVDLSDVTMEYQGELSELQNDDSIKALFKIKGTMMWLCEETQAKYPNTSSLARKLLLPFPSSCLVECGFSAVNDLLLKKRNRLDITKRGDLRLKLTKFLPRIKSLCSRHQAQGSH